MSNKQEVQEAVEKSLKDRAYEKFLVQEAALKPLKFKDKVKIIEGFYEGFEAEVIAQRTRVIYVVLVDEYYETELGRSSLLGPNDSESQLNKVRKLRDKWIKMPADGQ